MKLKNKINIMIFITVIITSFFTGCGKENNADKGGDSKEKLLALYDYAFVADYSLGKFHETDKGYYRVSDKSIKLGLGSSMSRSKFMMYADKSNSANWIYLCNKPNCRHNNEDCNAYIGDISDSAGVWIYKDHIYYYTWGQLCRMDMDGSNHEAVRDLPHGGQGVSLILYWYGKYIYCHKNVENDVLTIYDLSFADEKEDVIIHQDKGDTVTIPLYPSYHMSFYTGRYILDFRYGTPTGEVRHEYYEWDKDNNSTIHLEDDDAYGRGAYFIDNHAYYYESNDGFYKKDMHNKEITKIVDAKEHKGRAIVTDHYLIETSLIVRDGKREVGKMYIYNLEGKLLNEMDVKLEPETYYVGPDFLLASDRLFFSIVKDRNLADYYYIYYQDIGKENLQYHYAYTTEGNYYYGD